MVKILVLETMDREALDRADSDAASTTSSKRRNPGASSSPGASSVSVAPSSAPGKHDQPDEITPIVSSDHVGRDYQTTDTTPTAREVSTDPTVAKTSIRQRNPQYQETGTRRSGARVEAEDEANADKSWLKKVADKYGSVELDNKGSTARDHLALGTCCNRTLSLGQSS